MAMVTYSEVRVYCSYKGGLKSSASFARGSETNP